MQIALTGTPGTGKTTVAALLPFKVVDLNSLVKGGLNLGVNQERDCLEADMDGLERQLEELDTDEIAILEGHFSHYFAEHAIVLRLAPLELRKRLEARGYSHKKLQENLEAEALDVILVEAVELCGRVDEIDTTSLSPEEVAERIIKIVNLEIVLPPGQVDWLEEFLELG